MPVWMWWVIGGWCVAAILLALLLGAVVRLRETRPDDHEMRGR